MKKIKRITEITVQSTVSLADLMLNEDEAYALIEAVDLGQGESGFTEGVIKRLIDSMLQEFKGYDSEIEDFKKVIREMVE